MRLPERLRKDQFRDRERNVRREPSRAPTLTTGVVRLLAGAQLDIPDRADADFDVLATVGNDRVALGVDGYGRLVAHDLDENAMGLVIGRQGSGKSVGLSIYAASALLHSYTLALIEPTKGGVDFGFARSFVRPEYDRTLNTPAAMRALQSLVAEGERRRAVQREAGVPKNSDLPSELRSTNVLILVDELTSLVAPLTIPKALAPGDPERVEVEELNVCKARIQSAIEKITREFRYIGSG